MRAPAQVSLLLHAPLPLPSRSLSLSLLLLLRRRSHKAQIPARVRLTQCGRMPKKGPPGLALDGAEGFGTIAVHLHARTRSQARLRTHADESVPQFCSTF